MKFVPRTFERTINSLSMIIITHTQHAHTHTHTYTLYIHIRIHIHIHIHLGCTRNQALTKPEFAVNRFAPITLNLCVPLLSHSLVRTCDHAVYCSFQKQPSYTFGEGTGSTMMAQRRPRCFLSPPPKPRTKHGPSVHHLLHPHPSYSLAPRHQPNPGHHRGIRQHAFMPCTTIPPSTRTPSAHAPAEIELDLFLEKLGNLIRYLRS